MKTLRLSFLALSGIIFFSNNISAQEITPPPPAPIIKEEPKATPIVAPNTALTPSEPIPAPANNTEIATLETVITFNHRPYSNGIINLGELMTAMEMGITNVGKQQIVSYGIALDYKAKTMKDLKFDNQSGNRINPMIMAKLRTLKPGDSIFIYSIKVAEPGSKTSVPFPKGYVLKIK